MKINSQVKELTEIQTYLQDAKTDEIELERLSLFLFVVGRCTVYCVENWGNMKIIAEYIVKSTWKI